ncbi:uncharacterized protein I303_108496 [Kwoniella dejecticola CBS 10117]|uniref:tRNA (uracil-O(2)-)-methyltransferase n=1 Tax=Kwoniella dejecticola CBS 10117 TaxID=1296121 RepID=A0A1A5ZX90_9TREE|nr:uncharacterized protein I303_07180 [Kwoniella dejecticola CBS 10117]OBR82421.1 hypothetical protein I303_07180 [Kwoniella dejecticola CBS 10117]
MSNPSSSSSSSLEGRGAGFRPPPFRSHRIPPGTRSPLTSNTTQTQRETDEEWIPVISAECYFPLSVFLSTIKTLSLHPERNSSLILRAEVLPEPKEEAHDAAAALSQERNGDNGQNRGNGNEKLIQNTEVDSRDPVKDQNQFEDLELDLVEELNVRLLPRQPRRDTKVDQRILFYRSREDAHPAKDSSGRYVSTEETGEDKLNPIKKEVGLVITIPQVQGEEEIPFYHPKVKKLAYLYESVPSKHLSEGSKPDTNDNEPSLEEESEVKDDVGAGAKVQGKLSIHYLPFPSTTLDSTITENMQSLSMSDSTTTTLTPGSSTSKTNPSPNLNPEFLPRPLQPKNRKRSPLAGPSIEVDETQAEPINPPAVILSENADVPPNTKLDQDGRRPPEGEERLYRTGLALAETIHRHGYGQLVGYQKRRIHDVIVPRDNFQDLYLVLKDRHRQLDSRAPKQGGLSKLEDVKRHVWKEHMHSHMTTPDDASLPIEAGARVDLSEWGEQDIAIAAFLMLLWKNMYPAVPKPEASSNGDAVEEEVREWDTWGRPQGGFIDLGCGNGLLVHILISEGYNGKGYELRSRRTWPLYPPRTQEALVELPIDPPSWFPETIDEWQSGTWPSKPVDVIGENTFLIGNHADELTPWIPLLSLLPSTPVPHLSLPCCLHSLDSHFDVLDFVAPEHPHTPKGGFENGLEPGVSRYQSYLIWLGWCGLKCGWEWEKEGLRVPSTKGWGIVARKRWTKGDEDKERQCREWALEQVNEVRRKGAFKVREKEGKDHL